MISVSPNNESEQVERDYRHPWLGVEVRHLATLSAVSRTGSFRQAARELGYVQSAVSQQIARLEQVVGACLVERQRGRRVVELTRAGELLAHRGERILGELRAARIELDSTDGGCGAIRLAVVRDCAPLLSRLLERVNVELPGVPIEVTEASGHAEIDSMLAHGDADVAVGASLGGPGIAAVTLLHDPFVAVAAPDSPIAKLQRVTSPEDLAGERLIVPAAAVSHGHLHAPALRLDRALQVPLAASVATLVAQHNGIGLVPQSTAPTSNELVQVPTAGLIAPQRVVLASDAGRRRSVRVETFFDAAARAFLDDGSAELALAA